MKKFFTILVVCTTFLCGLNAEVLLKDSFARDLGNLHSGTAQDDMGTNTTNWYTGSTGTKYFQVVDTSLTFAGYQTTKAGRAVENDGSSVSIVRAFSSAKSSGSVYLSCIIRMKNPTRNSSATPSIVSILSMGSGIASSKQFGKILYQPSGAGFKVAPGKYTESATYLRWSKELEVNKEYLLVLRYDFVEGTKNDSVSLWINPTKTDEGQPTIIQKKDTTTSGGSAAGTNSRDDAASLGYAWITSGSFAPKDIIVDEVRVATKWAELFEGGGGDEPELGLSPTSIAASYIFQGDEKTFTINVTGQKLAGDVAISNQNDEVALSTTKITKAAAEEGAEFTATIKANKAGEQTDTITLVSGTIIKKIPVTWSTVGVASCANIKALKDSVNGQESWSKYVRLSGEAIVTRDTTISSKREIYIEDATGAAKITDDYSKLDADNLVGAKIKDFVFINSDEVLGVQPFIAQGKPTIVSTGNEVEPQVVTLAELQANAADYLLELVMVKKVNFSRSDTLFKAGNWEITQDSKTANVKVEMGNGITGNQIPAIANVIGFSLNTSGNVIVPRGTGDIIDANPAMMSNAGFEKYKETSFMGTTSTTFNSWSFDGGMEALAAEKTDIIEGETALKTTNMLKKKGNLDQTIDCSNYLAGNQFKIRICYKNLSTEADSLLVLGCYWMPNGGKDVTDIDPQLTQVLPYSAVWDTVEIVTPKPENAGNFYFRLTIKKNTQVLLDNFAFEYVEPTTPYFVVLPEKTNYTFTGKVNQDTTVARLTIRQSNLTQPVQLVWSISTDTSVYSVTKSQVTAAEETVEVKFKAGQAGKYNATLNIMNDESPEASLYNTTISFAGTAIDPAQKAVLTVTPQTFSKFNCKAYQTVTDSFVVSSENCTDYVHVVVDDETGPDWAFGLSGSFFLPNSSDKVYITFQPEKAGDYTATFKAYTTGVDTIFFTVSGHADDGQPEPTVVDWDTVFNWNMTNPYKELNEGFKHAEPTYHNKTLKTSDWQNICFKGARAWWGFGSDTTTQAKMTSWMYRTDSGSVAYETWLVTPALDYKQAKTQTFTFKVMSDLIYKGQTGRLQVYYIDATQPNDVFFQPIEALDTIIPANDSELSGQWIPVELNLMNQSNIADVFFMAFKFTDMGGNNGVTYYVSDVTWGVYGPEHSDLKEAQNAECTMLNVHKFMNNGKLYILKDGKRYNILGQLQ